MEGNSKFFAFSICAYHFYSSFLIIEIGDLAVWVRNSLGTETEYEMVREEGKRGSFIAKVRTHLCNKQINQ
jgi:hypothetical protein